MLKKPASFVLAALGGSTYRNVRLTTPLAAAALDDLFDHPAGYARCASTPRQFRVAGSTPLFFKRFS